MAAQLKLMCVFARPDDESMGTGGTLAKYGAEGIETYLITATRGERGWQGDPADNPGLTALGTIRERELRAAAGVLGLREVHFLDYVDGELDQADSAEAIAKIVGHLRRVRPHVVITFGPEGAYGHPDHIAICQFTSAAAVCAADTAYHDADSLPPHRVSKLYYMVVTQPLVDAYFAAFGTIVMPVDGVGRAGYAYPDWFVTTRIDTARYWQRAWDAVSCHRSQLPGYQVLEELPHEHHEALWGCQTYYRAYSVVNGGRQVEHDLFEGLQAG